MNPSPFSDREEFLPALVVVGITLFPLLILGVLSAKAAFSAFAVLIFKLSGNKVAVLVD